MMTLIRILIVVGLIAAIVGGSAWFSYELFWKPKALDRADRAAKEAAAALPPVDLSLPVYEKAAALRASGDVSGARTALTEFLEKYPSSVKAPEARAALGEINARRMFSSDSPGSESYTVRSGDSLVRIAHHFKSNAELIYRVNNLDTIRLQVGQQLVIPRPDIRVVIDRKAATVTLYNKGEFFREYAVVSLQVPPGSKEIATKVADKLAMDGHDRVAFGDKKYVGSERWVMLAGSGIVLRGMPAGEEAKPPPGVVLSAPDAEQIFLLVSRGTPVTIQ